ncbi:5,10-methylenetetrahydrofolate reductase [Prochlorococcus sp. SS52]|nr:5,10-methylenetetrahydrofolate reductase [Prochlorococcus sp. SS52]
MSILNRLEQAKEQDLEGITIAAEQARSFVGIAKGIHIMAIKAEHNIPAILNQAKISLPSQ